VIWAFGVIGFEMMVGVDGRRICNIGHGLDRSLEIPLSIIRPKPFKIELCLYGFSVLLSSDLDLMDISPNSLAICFKRIWMFLSLRRLLTLSLSSSVLPILLHIPAALFIAKPAYCPKLAASSQAGGTISTSRHPVPNSRIEKICVLSPSLMFCKG
jgi:hypothetical protein